LLMGEMPNYTRDEKTRKIGVSIEEMGAR